MDTATQRNDQRNDQRPEPLTSNDIDLRDFAYMPLDVGRLRDCDLVSLATGDEFRAAALLWCAAWHQTPAASLPKDDRLLAKLAGFGRDLEGWKEVSEMALHGFVECSDGRLYHPVIAQYAHEAWAKKLAHKARTAAATEARKDKAKARPDERSTSRTRTRKADDQRNDQRNDNRDDQRYVHQGKGNRTELKGKILEEPPLAPHEGVGGDDFHSQKRPSREEGTNPRAQGTSPRQATGTYRRKLTNEELKQRTLERVEAWRGGLS